MKFLLTSAGIKNKSIESALSELIGKPLEETRVAFIPTAADVEPGHKDWFIKNINEVVDLGVKSFDIVDIAAIDRSYWEPRLKEADLLYVSGGNEFFLMYNLIKSGLRDFLPELLKTRAWLGVSAGSMVVGKRITPELSRLIYEEEIVPPFNTVETFLEYVDFAIKPHMNSVSFPKASEANLEIYAPQIPNTFYGIDDQSAIKVIDGKIEIVSEGAWKKFN